MKSPGAVRGKLESVRQKSTLVLVEADMWVDPRERSNRGWDPMCTRLGAKVEVDQQRKESESVRREQKVLWPPDMERKEVLGNTWIVEGGFAKRFVHKML